MPVPASPGRYDAASNAPHRSLAELRILQPDGPGFILKLAPDAARQNLEAMMTTSEYEKTFVEKIHDQGKAEMS